MESVESMLWILLALYLLITYPSYYSLSVVCGSLLSTFFPPTCSNRYHCYWRHQTATVSDQGCCMSIVVIPVLLQAISLYNNEKWTIYYRLSSIMWVPQQTATTISQQILVTSLIGALAASVHYWMNALNTQDTIWIILLWNILYSSIAWFTSLHKVFTNGEWNIVSSLATIAMTEWTCHYHARAQHSFVAFSGVIGCGVACVITRHIQHIRIRGTILILLPLVTVEGALLWYLNEHDDHIVFPRAATWLMHFLMTTETPLTVSSYLPTWPRYMWLVYWAVMVLFALFSSPHAVSSVVILRKWFHFVAILLFAPVTCAAPQLMSLSYAIALCVLAVLEHLRANLPTVCQEFYARYVDPHKDAHQDIVIVSHMTLILGCAMPLWIYECAMESVTGDEITTSLLLPLFGILVLGVGDSLAAVVGTMFGKTEWPFGTNTRTLEGSAAMWLGMATCCYYCGVSSTYWIPAVTFTTLLEAFTTQIDNLVLPLAGAALLLLSEQK